jgi:membrane fusion protein, multidrug efflux system
MRLGSTVIGRIKLSAPPGVEIPQSALAESDGRSAVWIVDPRSQTVSLRGVEVARYEQAGVVISKGLETGELVVTAGVQTLRPGQKVSIVGAAS